MGVLAHHPELTAAYNQLIRHALYFSAITPRQRELLVLRVAHLRDSTYEWAQHVVPGRCRRTGSGGDRPGARGAFGSGVDAARTVRS